MFPKQNQSNYFEDRLIESVVKRCLVFNLIKLILCNIPLNLICLTVNAKKKFKCSQTMKV